MPRDTDENQSSRRSFLGAAASGAASLALDGDCATGRGRGAQTHSVHGSRPHVDIYRSRGPQ